MGKKRSTVPVGTEPTAGASEASSGTVDGGEVVPVTLRQLRAKIKDLEIQQKRKPGNKRQDPVFAEIARLKTPRPVEVDEEQALAPFMDVIEDGHMNDDEKCIKIQELCARQAAEVQRLEASCAMMLEACTSLRTRTLEEEIAAYELRKEASKKTELQSKLQELCRVQAQQCKETKKGTEEQSKAEETRMQEVTLQVEKIMGDIKDRMEAKKQEHEARLREKELLAEKLILMREEKQRAADEFEKLIVDREGDVVRFTESMEKRRRVLEGERLITARGREALEYLRQRSVALEQQRAFYISNIKEHEDQKGKVGTVIKDAKERILKLGQWRDELRSKAQELRDTIESRIKEQEQANENLKATKPLLDEALATKVRLEKACRQLQVERAQRLAAARANSKQVKDTKQSIENGVESQEPQTSAPSESLASV